MFESAHFTPRPHMWRVIFRDQTELRLLKRPYERQDDLEQKALKKKYGSDYINIVAKIRDETGMNPILRFERVGAE